jgi:hypothetical protein
MISKKGPTIGGSSGPELELLNQSARGIHNWLLRPFETLLNQFFIQNHYPFGWTVKLKIKLREPDKSDINLKQAAVGIQGQCVDLDDLRQKLDYEAADDAKKASIAAFWANKVPAPAPAQFSKHVHQFTEDSVIDETAKMLEGDIDVLSKEILKALQVAA